MLNPGKGKSRRLTGRTQPTVSPRDKAKKEYWRKRNIRKKCRENNKDPSACKVCPNEHRCRNEATEDYINAEKAKMSEKDSLSADNENKSQKEVVE